VLNNGSYDCSDWFSEDCAITEQGVWDHIEAACGNVWLHEVDFNPLDSCQIYWSNRELSRQRTRAGVRLIRRSHTERSSMGV